MMTRLQFLRSLGALGLAAVSAPALVACTKDDDPTPDAGNNNNNPDASMGGPKDAGVDAPKQPMSCATITAAIGTNHGHTITVPAADVAAGVEKTYQIQGSSAHPHTVKVTGPNFATLKQNGSLTLTSSNDANHTHSVTLTCGS